MCEKKEDMFYTRYYLFGKCIWKREKSAKEMVSAIMEEMNGRCANMNAIMRKNNKKILMHIAEHYEPKKVAPKKTTGKKRK